MSFASCRLHLSGCLPTCVFLAKDGRAVVSVIVSLLRPLHSYLFVAIARYSLSCLGSWDLLLHHLASLRKEVDISFCFESAYRFYQTFFTQVVLLTISSRQRGLTGLIIYTILESIAYHHGQTFAQSNTTCKPIKWLSAHRLRLLTKRP